MKLSQFIRTRIDPIVAGWEDFARTLPAGRSMTPLALRDHGREILLTITADMQRPMSDLERTAQAEDITTAAQHSGTPAAEHGALRQMAGFDLVQLFAEFRALRASVMLLWKQADAARVTADSLDDILLFNEGMDKALAESVQRYSSEVSASRDMFLAVLGHDLRSPLSGIQMSTLLLSKPDLDVAARHKAAARIKRASTEMGGLITDLLEYTRTRLGAGMPMELADCDVGAVCEDALEAIRTGFPEQQFVQTLLGDLTLQADAPRLHQALSNLLANAVQHGHRGTPIRFSATGEAREVVLTIGNAGAGTVFTLRLPRRPPEPQVAGAAAPENGPVAPSAGKAAKDVALPLPHERDQSAHDVAAKPDPLMVQAYQDLEAGMVDTDMRATPGLDAQRRAELVPGPGGKPPGKAR